MRVVGRSEAAPARERIAYPQPLRHRGRHREPEEREPGDGGERVRELQGRHRDEDQHAREVGRGGRAGAQGDRARSEVRRRDQRSRDEEDRRLFDRLPAERDLVDGREHGAERKHLPEVIPVELNRLGDELPDGSRLGRKRLGPRRHG